MEVRGKRKINREVNKCSVLMYKRPSPYLKAKGKFLMKLRGYLWSTYYVTSTVLYVFILYSLHDLELLVYDSETDSEKVKY